MKKILVICTNKIVAQQMKVYSLNADLSTKYYFFVEKNNQTGEINKILKKFKNKEISIFKPVEKPSYFNIINFYNFFKIKIHNKKIKIKLNKLINIKKIFDKNILKYGFQMIIFQSKFYIKKKTKIYFFSRCE